MRALRFAATAWFVVAAVGQGMFAAYVVGAYGWSIVTGRLEGWNQLLPGGHGYIAGDTLGNTTLLVHLALVAVVVGGGILQLIPAVRRRSPALHRWIGRAYLAAVVVVSAGGLILKLVREPAGTPAQTLASEINAVLILAFAAVALHHARARRIAAHRRWALRLFLAASGVWFIRVGWWLWSTTVRALGRDPDVDGLFTAMSFGQFVVPLVVLELYLRAQDGGPRSRAAMAATLGALTLLTAAGIVAVTVDSWIPRLVR